MWGVNIWVKLQEAPVTDLKILPLFFWTKWNLIKNLAFGIWYKLLGIAEFTALKKWDLQY